MLPQTGNPDLNQAVQRHVCGCHVHGTNNALSALTQAAPVLTAPARLAQLDGSFPAHLPGGSSGSSGAPPQEEATAADARRLPQLPAVGEDAPPPPAAAAGPAGAEAATGLGLGVARGQGGEGGAPAPLGAQPEGRAALSPSAPQTSASTGKSSSSDRTADLSMEALPAAVRPACQRSSFQVAAEIRYREACHTSV